MNKLYCLWHKGPLVGDILSVEVVVVRSRREQNEGISTEGCLTRKVQPPGGHWRTAGHLPPYPSPSGTLDQESTSAGLRLDSQEGISRLPQFLHPTGKMFWENSRQSRGLHRSWLCVRTMAPSLRLFRCREKSINKSEMGFNNPVATSDQSASRGMGLRD